MAYSYESKWEQRSVGIWVTLHELYLIAPLGECYRLAVSQGMFMLTLQMACIVIQTSDVD